MMCLFQEQRTASSISYCYSLCLVVITIVIIRCVLFMCIDFVLQKILSIKEVVYEKSENKHRRVPVVPYEVLNPGTHANFRLWFITQPSQGRYN